ncbi:MAG: helix-turn-helix domain-containing protein [Acidimicrobiales bacterium]|jgi:DNA-binding transcriptional MerR regulator
MLNIGEFARLGQVSPRMLRHYDELGLLDPALVDPDSGYRLYSVRQLSQLHRVVALRDMGFTLEQIREILAENLPVDQLRGMLRLRRAQLAQNVGEEQERLRRIEAHLRALERAKTVDVNDVVIKRTQPVRVAQAVAGGLTYADIAGACCPRLSPTSSRSAPNLGSRLPAMRTKVAPDKKARSCSALASTSASKKSLTATKYRSSTCR